MIVIVYNNISSDEYCTHTISLEQGWYTGCSGQLTALLNFCCSCTTVTCGVHQGSVLGRIISMHTLILWVKKISFLLKLLYTTLPPFVLPYQSQKLNANYISPTKSKSKSAVILFSGPESLTGALLRFYHLLLMHSDISVGQVHFSSLH